MANRTIFRSTQGKMIPPTNTTNDAGGNAYAMSAKHALAQLASTGTLNKTFYATGEQQLDRVLENAIKCSPEYVAKCAVYARQRGYMKDMPALLVAHLSTRLQQDHHAFRKAFIGAIDNGKMLRNFVQIMRSGVVGRKSLGTHPKKMVQWWLQNRTPYQLFRDSVGTSPSLSDVIKMVHPKPNSTERDDLFAYLIGKKGGTKYPDVIRQWEAFKTDPDEAPVPNVPFQMLASVNASPKVWKQIARDAKWQMTRMNLNTFQRHGVFEDQELVDMIASRLANPENVRSARAFPYQLLAAYHVAHQVPVKVRNALQDAMEIATENVPAFSGDVWVLPDVSGSMQCSVTGERRGSTSAVRCVDVAALVASSVLRRCDNARVVPFDTRPYLTNDINQRDSVMTNAEKLARYGGGGTACSVALAQINALGARADLCIFVSDNESWVDSNSWKWRYGTATMEEWSRIKKRCPQAKLVCLDLVPNTNTQTVEREDILNIGGFSDNVWEVIAEFAKGDFNAKTWVDKIEAIEL